MAVDSKMVDFEGNYEMERALVDSGTSYILLANPVYYQVKNKLLANGCTANSARSISCHCNEEYWENYPNITFYTRGASFTIEPFQYLVNGVKLLVKSCFYLVCNSFF